METNETRRAKIPYEIAAMEAIWLDTADVITTSPVPEDTDDNQGPWDGQLL